MVGHRGNDLLLPHFTTRWLQQRQRPLPLSLSSTLYIVTLRVISHQLYTPYIHNKFSLSPIYTNMTFGLFKNIAPLGSEEHIYIYAPSIRGEVLTGPATSSSSQFPSGGTCFLTDVTTFVVSGTDAGVRVGEGGFSA